MRALAGWTLALLLLAAGSARAEPTPAEAELATARALFEEGLAREDAKDWTGALERFRRVAEIRVTPQVLYNMALCFDRLDRPASADKHYTRVEREAESSSDPAVRELGRLATARRREIRSTIPEVVIRGPRDPSTAITLDDAPLAEGAIGVATPIDPGEHRLRVVRRGKEASRAFVVRRGRTTVDAPLPADPMAPQDEPVPAAAWVSGGLAVVGLGVLTAALLMRGSAISDLDATCGTERAACPESKRPDVDRVGDLTAVANTAAIVAAAAAIATGAILVFVWKRPGG